MEALAIAAMLFAGKKLTENPPPESTPERAEAPPQVETDRFAQYSTYMNTHSGVYDDNVETQGYGMSFYQPKRESGNTGVIAPTIQPGGQPSSVPQQQARQMEYLSGRRHNEPVVPQTLVGPGVGLPAEQTSGGGYHQLYRSMPILGTAHRLTQLPGGVGPPAPVIRQGPTMAGELTNIPTGKGYKAPEPIQGRAAATGSSGRQRQTFTERPTNRAETGYRNDELEFAPSKHHIQQSYGHDGEHTREGNELPSSLPLNHGGVQQGLANSGYLGAPTDLRKAENRGNEDRAGNPGRMNVLADPGTRAGALTTARLEYEQTRPTQGLGDAARFRQRPEIGGITKTQVNKGNANPLDPTIMGPLVKNQLQNNPLNHSLGG